MKHPILASIGIAAVLTLPFGVAMSCGASPALQEEIDTTEAEAIKREAAVKTAVDAATKALAEATTPEEVENATRLMLEAQGKADEFDAWLSARAAELAEKHRQDQLERSSPWASALNGIVPGAGLVVTGLFSTGLFSKRYREHMLDGVKKANPFVGGTIDWKGALASVAKAQGWKHTSDDPKALASVVAKVASEKGALTEVERAAILAELDAARAAVDGVGKAAA
jgi:hypothetical protein